MVHALGEIHRVLSPGQILVDARPDSRVVSYVEHRTARGFERFGILRTNRIELQNDRASDLAIATAVREGKFKRGRRGRLWYRVPFAGLAELRRYLSEHQRFVRRPQWSADAATLRRHAQDEFAIRRAVRYELLETQRSRDRRSG